MQSDSKIICHKGQRPIRTVKPATYEHMVEVERQKSQKTKTAQTILGTGKAIYASLQLLQQQQQQQHQPQNRAAAKVNNFRRGNGSLQTLGASVQIRELCYTYIYRYICK